LAGLAVLAIAAIPRLPRGYRLKGVAAVIAGTVLAVQLTDPGWWERMRSLGPASGDAAITTRLAYWHASLRMVADYPLGIGIGNYHDAVRSYLPELGVSRSAHSTYHECLAELGYAGFALFALAILAAFIELRTASRLADRGTDGGVETPALRWQALAIDGALAAYLGCALFVTRFFSEDLWLLVGMACCAANVARARQSVKRDAPVAVPQLCAPVRGATCRPVLG
jgi:O-antigen ligase